ncbi:MAG: YdiU family protein [Halioglobus sp.]
MSAIAFDNTYAKLPSVFHSDQAPTPVQAPSCITVNVELAQQLGIDPAWLNSDAGIAMLVGNSIPAGAQPIATVYAGHQFGGFNPRLGDGRAVLLGEVCNAQGERFDLQLKGAGPTAYSRGGDGRSPLGPVLREYAISEAMHTLGVPTTRALAATMTGELVYREEALPGAVLARVASSHIRVGTFEFFAASKDPEPLRTLADYVIGRHYPQCADAENPYEALLLEVIEAQAALIARWQSLGFIHGVMNTDNMLICGETVDYGPCAFMDSFNPNQVYSSIDHQGRYAYSNQPGIGHWNLSRLAQGLVPLLHPDTEKAVPIAQAAIDTFPERYQSAHAHCMARKLGLEALNAQDNTLIESLWDIMEQEHLDFTLLFRRLTEIALPTLPGDSVDSLITLPPSMSPWLERWQARLTNQPPGYVDQMLHANPAFIPRNHQLEHAIAKGSFEGDLEPFDRLLQVLENPFEFRVKDANFAMPPEPQEVVKQTFCGT